MICSVLFSAILASRVGRIMNNIPPASSVFRQSYQFLHCQSSPFLYVAQPVCSWSSSFPISRHCALHDVFLQAYSLSSHDVSEVTRVTYCTYKAKRSAASREGYLKGLLFFVVRLRLMLGSYPTQSNIGRKEEEVS